jgi:hypothetical protein
MLSCSKCKANKEESAFYRRRNIRGYSFQCKTCHREYTRSHYIKNKQSYIDRAIKAKKKSKIEIQAAVIGYLKQHPCVDCGEPDVIVLQFDHVRGKKSGHVSRIIHTKTRVDSVMKEISKCDVRCANCHLRKTSRDFKFWKDLADI